MKENEILINESEISIFKLFLAIWKHRVLIILLSILVTALLCFCSLSAYLYMGKTDKKEYNITFVLDFLGLNKKTYPNGEKFNPVDIISSNILNEVYSNNNLSEYMTYVNFEKSVSVYQLNNKAELLSAYYKKMIESSSSRFPANFALLNKQFTDDKENALNNNEYQIKFFPEFLKKSIPDMVVNKFLQDILKTWNEVSINVKGIGLYPVSILALEPNILKSKFSEDPMITYFKIQSVFDKVNDNVSEIDKISGAATMKIGFKDKVISLSGIKQDVRMLNDFEFNPLLDQIKQIARSSNNSLTINYLKRKIYESQIIAGKLQAQKELYEKILKEYLNSNSGSAQQQGAQQTTQKQAYNVTINDDFFHQIKGFIEGNSNRAYCQKLSDELIKTGLKLSTTESQINCFTDLLKSFEENKNIMNNPQLNTEIKNRYNDVYEKLCIITEQVNFFYKSLSSYNLLPKNTLYSVEYSSVKATESSIKKLLVISVAAWILLELIIISSVLLAVKFKSIK